MSKRLGFEVPVARRVRRRSDRNPIEVPVGVPSYPDAPSACRKLKKLMLSQGLEISVESMLCRPSAYRDLGFKFSSHPVTDNENSHVGIMFQHFFERKLVEFLKKQNQVSEPISEDQLVLIFFSLLTQMEVHCSNYSDLLDIEFESRLQVDLRPSTLDVRGYMGLKSVEKF